jgi:hypothetical protein
MDDGPGVYDGFCTMVREANDARCVVLLVVGGDHGNGFSVQAEENFHGMVPDLLEAIARQIRVDRARGH